MIRNFFTIAFRNLSRNKSFPIINISGLAIGMAAAILIGLWIKDEMTYDNFHVKKDRIYEVWNRLPSDGEVKSWNRVSAPTAAAIYKDVPEVEAAVRMDAGNTLLFSNGDKHLVKHGAIVDTGFLDLFTFPLLKGNIKSALINMHSVLLTETAARSLFQ